MFWGLTPTVGLQSTVLIIMFTLGLFLSKITGGRFRYLEFNFPLAITLSWISNPFNAPVLYFGFYYLGALLMPGYEPLGFQEFIKILSPLLNVGDVLGSLSNLSDYFINLGVMVVDLGVKIVYPLVMGSLVLAIPASIVAYLLALRMIDRFEQKKRKKVPLNYFNIHKT